ncbi:ribonuclease D [Vibrio astriarenae]|uniref:ribonuclease D n=1 Tax=Vibrio astriarenae TaxID=1481923 RepID=UPI003735C15B
MKYQIIKSQEALVSVCEAARQAEKVMLDTEFVRIRSYFPKLGLVQLFDGVQLSLIDPLELSDLTPLAELLADESVLKVLHACGEDLEVFQNDLGCLPTPMVDTQIMAAFLGHGLSTGFASLVNEYLGIELDKSESRADWTARPLTAKQLDYAAADVHYLWPLHDTLVDKLAETPWEAAALEESASLALKRIKNIDITKLYRDIKGAWQLKPRQLAVLQPLAAWRYKEAVKRDLALNFVFKENELLDIASQGVTSTKAMEKMGIDPRSIRRHGEKIVHIVKKAQKIPQEDYPSPITRVVDLPGYKQEFKLLKDQVKKVSSNVGLATEFLASKKQLNQFIRWVKDHDMAAERTPDVMNSWRLECFENSLVTLLKK